MFSSRRVGSGYGTQVTRLDGKCILALSHLPIPSALHSDKLKNYFYFFIQNWTYIFICLYLFSVPKLKRNIMFIFTVCIAVIDPYLLFSLYNSEQVLDWSRQWNLSSAAESTRCSIMGLGSNSKAPYLPLQPTCSYHSSNTEYLALFWPPMVHDVCAHIHKL